MLPEAPAERVRALLERIVEELGLEASVAVEEGDEEIHADIEGEEVGLLIGRHGQTIDAIQLLCYQAAFRGLQERKRVVVDAAGYRERRRASRCAARADLAAEDADPARPGGRDGPDGRPRSGASSTSTSSDRPEVETYSEGDEPNRCVVVAPLVSGLSASAAAPPPSPPSRRCSSCSAEPRAPVARRRARAGPGRSTSPTASAGSRSSRSPGAAGSPTSAAGPGFPGLALAAVPARGAGRPDRVGRPQVRVHAPRRSSGWDSPTPTVVCARSEELGRAARAARPTTRSPPARSAASRPSPSSPRRCSREGGVLVAWKGAALRRGGGGAGPRRRSAGDRADRDPLRCGPIAGSRDRHIHLLRKNGPTPNELPRRPGLAAKRPFGSEQH